MQKLYSKITSIDEVREEAARCCDETAKMARGERGPLRLDPGSLTNEFSDAAAGVAGEVAMVVGDALRARGMRWRNGFPWEMAATMLRNGWQRGHKLTAFEVGGAKGAKA